ncbi:MAG: extracellular solute-binding protein [Lachnospiraceae bacterium]|nr:extracellular solute-binding protein [Lachnospiraceae bacterium]
MLGKKGFFSAILAVAGLLLTGCGDGSADNKKTVIELVHYKQEAVDYFEEVERQFNDTHDDIELKISSPNDAMTVLKTRFIRKDNPDIIGIGGDYDYSNFIDADMLMDVSDFDGLKDIKENYLEINENLEFIPTEGTYGVPYMANAAGILYNKDMFEEHGWQIPETWDELIALCEDIKAEGILPFYMGYKDTWTCISPWNSAASCLTEPTVCKDVNKGNTTFSKEYATVAEQMKTLLEYGPKDFAAYSYNDACTAFARGESAMFMIGSYAVPQIKSVNPDLNIDSFVYPASNNKEDNILTSGIDLQFCIMKDCPNKEAAYEVLRFLLEDENVQAYMDDQNAIPCKEGSFQLAPMLDGMKEYIEESKVTDFQDHFYPSEMAANALIQTYLLDGDTEKFLQKFDEAWVRYNRDLIEKVQKYEAEHESEGE